MEDQTLLPQGGIIAILVPSLQDLFVQLAMSANDQFLWLDWWSLDTLTLHTNSLFLEQCTVIVYSGLFTPSRRNAVAELLTKSGIISFQFMSKLDQVMSAANEVNRRSLAMQADVKKLIREAHVERQDAPRAPGGKFKIEKDTCMSEKTKTAVSVEKHSILIVGAISSFFQGDEIRLLHDPRVLLWSKKDIRPENAIPAETKVIIYCSPEIGREKVHMLKQQLREARGRLSEFEVHNGEALKTNLKNTLRFQQPVTSSISNQPAEKFSQGDNGATRNPMPSEMPTSSLKELPTVFDIPFGKRIAVIGINPQTVTGLVDDLEKFSHSEAKEARKWQSLPPDFHLIIFLKSMIDSFPTDANRLKQLAAAIGVTVIDRRWGVADLREWLATAKIQWRTKSQKTPRGSAADPRIEEAEKPAEETIEDFTAGEADLLTRYQITVRDNAELRRQVQLLTSKVKGLQQILDNSD